MWLRPQTANEKLKLDAQTQDGIEKKKLKILLPPIDAQIHVHFFQTPHRTKLFFKQKDIHLGVMSIILKKPPLS